ncbi:antitoxin VbhA family protein [Alcaligenes faecalis]|uniref:antitoxin VbhA family protein n=1 Tax=Alcaligenes faecalis TaxID=511 RepID=UPI001FF96DA1|nr:antitoxin VbhA family protein [Alcaligenes faecalis]
MVANIAVNRENLLIGRKTRQFLPETFLPVFLTKPKKIPAPCKIALPKARETTMAEMGSHETKLTKTITSAERDRRVAAVNYARASVGSEGFSLSAADEEHAQRFISGDIDLEEFVQPRSALASPKA